MLKKSLIPAALVALSSASAFADADSFHFGLKGLYFKPAASEALGALNKSKLAKSDQKVASTGNILFIGPQFGYHISDSIRVGVAGYMGFGEFKSEFKAKSQNKKENTGSGQSNDSSVPISAILSEHGLSNKSSVNVLTGLEHLESYLKNEKSAAKSLDVINPVDNAINLANSHDQAKTLPLSGKLAFVASEIVFNANPAANPDTASAIAIEAGSRVDFADKAYQRFAPVAAAVNAITPADKVGGSTDNKDVAKLALYSVTLSESEQKAYKEILKEVLSEDDLDKQKAAVAKLMKQQKALAKKAKGDDSDTSSKDDADKDASSATPDAKEGKWTETIAPRGVILATVDAKLFENDAFSLGAGIGVGATNWKATWKLDSESQKDDAADLPSKKEATAWALSGMGTVNANIGLGDVATLTASAGYMYLGNPELTYGNTNGGATGTNFKADESRSQGWVFGIGIGKDF